MEAAYQDRHPLLYTSTAVNVHFGKPNVRLFIDVVSTFFFP